MRSDCVCQNWHHGHPEAALYERLPSLVCVLPVVSRFQMKGAKREKNEIHKPIRVSLYNRKMLLACPPPAGIHSPSPLSSSALPPSMGMDEIVSLLSAASSSMCKAGPFNWFPSLDLGQAWQLAAATTQ